MLIEAVAQRNFGRLFITAAAAATLPLVPCRLLHEATAAWQRLSARLCDRYSFLERITTASIRNFLAAYSRE
jgi:hypothetical protein